MLEKQSQQELVAAYWAVLAIGSLGDEKARNILQQHQVPIESGRRTGALWDSCREIGARKDCPGDCRPDDSNRRLAQLLREAQSWAEEKGLGKSHFWHRYGGSS